MKQGHYTEKELIDIFVSPLSEAIYEIVNINHIVHFIYKDEDYYVMLRSVSYAGNPHPLHRFRAQLPRRPYLEAYKHNGGVFLFIGYVAEHNVYVLWNPYPLRSRLNEKDTVSLFCELDSIIKAKNEGLVWSKLPNGGLYVTFTPENLSSVLESLSYFKTEVPLPKHTNGFHSESLLSKFIVDLSSKGLSRLEIVESCMSKFASEYPDLEYNDWSDVIRKLSKSNEIDEHNEVTITLQVPISITEKYIKAKNKICRLVDWGENTPIPFEKWGINGVSKWLNALGQCIKLCQCLEIDHADGFINDDLYFEIKENLACVESYTNSLPQKYINEYKKSKIKESISRIWLPGKISIQEADNRNVPINIFRQQIGGMRNITNLSDCIHLTIPVKERYSRGDLYLEQLTRIPDLISEEELEYLDAYRQGNESAREAIIESVMPSGIALATRFLYKRDEMDFLPIFHRTTLEDIVQYVALIVIEAFDTYHPSAVSNFKNYALENIRRRLGDFIAKEECLLSYRRPRVEELVCCGIPNNLESKSDNCNTNRKIDKQKEQKVVIYNLSYASIEKWDNLFAEAKYSRTYLWATAIIKKFSQPDTHEISLVDLYDEMIACSWHFILDNKPYLYQFDNLCNVILGLKRYVKLDSQQNATDVYNSLQLVHKNPLYNKRVYELLSGVPWGFLRAWIPNENTAEIEKLSRKFTNECMYSIESTKFGLIIRINPHWKSYIEKESDNMLRYVDGAYKKLIMQYNPKNEKLKQALQKKPILY